MAENPFGHSPDCSCEQCRDWRDVEIGVAALGRMKSMKAAAHAQTKPCESCHAQVDSLAKFCPSCGKPFPRKVTLCAFCEKEIGGARFCPFCGHAVG